MLARVFVSENAKQRRQIHVSQKQHVLCCICVRRAVLVGSLVVQYNILCHASAERWELLASGLMSITPPRSVKEAERNTLTYTVEDVLIIITAKELHLCYFQAKDRQTA